MEIPEDTRELPQWLRVLARVDFVAAVALTVVAPLLLLARALRASHRDELGALLRYWRASSLLMVTVYLLMALRADAQRYRRAPGRLPRRPRRAAADRAHPARRPCRRR